LGTAHTHLKQKARLGQTQSGHGAQQRSIWIERPTFLLSVARLGLYYNTRQAGGQEAQFTELWYLRLATPTAERLTVILFQGWDQVSYSADT
jgi:hypothetical protein